MGRLCCAFNQALKCYKFIWKDGCRRENVCCTAAVHEAVLMVQCYGGCISNGYICPRRAAWPCQTLQVHRSLSSVSGHFPLYSWGAGQVGG
jgi:hypothetical protein